MNKNRMFGLLTIALCFTAGCGSVLNFDSLVWEEPDGGTDGSVPDSGLPDSGNPDAGPDAGTDGGLPDGGPPDGGWDGGLNPCIPNPCTAPNKGICTPTGVTTFSCSCNAGYHDVSGNCVMDQTCQGNSCGGHGQCTTPGGVVTCSCDVGYEPLYCGTCSTNWQDNDSNGSCLMACSNPSLVLNCNSHGNCLDTSGTSVCSCSNNWTGSDCNTCPAGFYVFGGNCVDDPCLPNPCLNGGACANGTGSVVCACAGNRDPATNCSACLAGYGGANCDPVATIAVAKVATGTSTALVNGDNTPLCVSISATGGNGSMARESWDVSMTGGGGPTAVSLYRDAWNGTLISSGASQVVTLAPFAGKWVAAFTTEDTVASGTPKVYCLRVAATGVVPASRLTVTFVGDSSAPATMVGGTGWVYNTSGSRLYTVADGLCSASGPNFVVAVLPHTAPTPTCNITAIGDPVYSTGFQVGTWNITNTMAP